MMQHGIGNIRPSAKAVCLFAAIGMAMMGLLACCASAQSTRQEGDRASAAVDDAPYDLRKLRFLGVHAVPLTSNSHRPEAVASIGEFTVNGPQMETLRPVLTTNIAHAAAEEFFGIGTRVDRKTGAFTRFTEEAIGRRPHGDNFTAMAFDSRRGRFLLADSAHLYAYDPQAKRWLWRKDNKRPLLGLVYDSDGDAFYGVVGENLNPRDMFLRERMAIERAQGRRRPVRNAPLTIRRLSPEGVAAGDITVSEPLPPKPVRGAFQTAFSQGLIVLYTDHSLFAIQPASGKVVYKGETTLLRGDKPWTHSDGSEITLTIDERREKLKQRIAALKGRLDEQPGAKLVRRLDYLSRCIAGEFAKEPITATPEIHAVGMHNVERPDRNTEAICPITVSHAGAPLILILSANESTTWRLEIESNVRVQQIVLAGQHKHRVEGVLDGTPVLDRTALEQPKHYFYVSSREQSTGARDGFASTAHAVFGSEPMTSQYDQSSYEIGPESEKWRTSYIDSLIRELERDVLLAENADLEFSAIFRRKVGNVEDSAVTAFSLQGPKKQKLESLSNPYMTMTRGPKSAELYVVDRKSEIHVLREPGMTEAIGPSPDVIPGRTTAICYDGRRDRLLAWHSQESRWKTANSLHGRVLMQYEPRTSAWRPLGGLYPHIGGVAHDQATDLFYALVLPIRSAAIRDLVVMNPHGAVLSAVPLSQPFYWDLDAGPPQAVFARNHLIVITPPQAALLTDGKERLVAQVIAIDPASGQTFFTGRYFCD